MGIVTQLPSSNAFSFGPLLATISRDFSSLTLIFSLNRSSNSACIIGPFIISRLGVPSALALISNDSERIHLGPPSIGTT